MSSIIVRGPTPLGTAASSSGCARGERRAPCPAPRAHALPGHNHHSGYWPLKTKCSHRGCPPCAGAPCIDRFFCLGPSPLLSCNPRRRTSSFFVPAWRRTRRDPRGRRGSLINAWHPLGIIHPFLCRPAIDLRGCLGSIQPALWSCVVWHMHSA